MTDPNIIKLARLTISANGINPDIARFVLKNLSRKELLTYLRYLKSYAEKKMVKITSANPVNAPLKTKILNLFPDRDIVFEQEEIGDGIRIQIHDTIIDLSLNGYLDTAIEKLKN